MAGIQAYNQAYLMADEKNAAVYDSFAARQMRYQLGWAFYESNQYDDFQTLSRGMKVQRGLYKYIQDIYNPVSRMGDFYKGVVWRGSLDLDAADKGAIPIAVGKKAEANEDQLRAAIAHVWKVSNWNVNKNISVLHGTILGDAALYIRDDLERGECRIEMLHPSKLKEVDIDVRGFVKSYIIEEQRKDEGGRVVTYTETCERGDNENVIFKTYKDRTPFAWGGNNDASGNPRAEWEEVYGFIPLVLMQHINEGRDWGKSAIQSKLKKIMVIDDEASLLHDQIRKVVNPFKLANFKRPTANIKATTDTPTTDTPQPGREKEDILYIDMPEASITPIITPLDIVGVSANIKMMLDNLENELPELRRDIFANVAEDTVKAARAQVESKVFEARINYDAGIISALQMAIAIGGARGYNGYDGFDLNSYDAGKLDCSVSDRAVFPESDEQIQNKKIQRWTVAADVSQKSGGAISAESVLKDLGMTDEEMSEMPTQRTAAWKIAREDTVPTDPETGEPMTQ